MEFEHMGLIIQGEHKGEEGVNGSLDEIRAATYKPLFSRFRGILPSGMRADIEKKFQKRVCDSLIDSGVEWVRL